VTREQIGGAWSPPRQLTAFGCAFQAWARDGSGLLCGDVGSTVLTMVSRAGAVRWRRDLKPTGLSDIGQGVLSTDGETLYVRGTRGEVAGVWAVPLAGGAPRLLVPFSDPTLQVESYPGTINVAGSRLYLTVGEFESDIWVMDLVRR
jgi:hypothetical protein